MSIDDHTKKLLPLHPTTPNGFGALNSVHDLVYDQLRVSAAAKNDLQLVLEGSL